MSSKGGWIGVDLDGTLAHYDGWMGWNQFGEPIPKMVERVKQWLAEGKDVRIFTARVHIPLEAFSQCWQTKTPFTGHDMVRAIQDYTYKHVGVRLPVTCVKDTGMIELWDDRAVQVIPNTGVTVAEEAVARYNASQGATYQYDSSGPWGRTVAEDHPSHNVSDSFFACYGCGLTAGHPGLKKPCPTPDAVGRMRMSDK